MKKINLDEFWSRRYPHGKLPKYAKEIAIEFAKEVLELAAENAKMRILIDDDNDIIEEANIDKQSILDTINQIK